MSYDIVWEFRLPATRASEFEHAYGPRGPWVQLFRRAPGYIETQLLRDAEDAARYLTVDRWESRESFEAFRHRHRADYDALDQQLEGLATSETRLGAFEAIP
ncbi:antibiotic biosynthesis monooxygenase family protein [Dyella jiangningensis]|nr:antibiotic biosynthesis monooxygenase family protein [Dyella jiangningensis]